MQETGTLAPLLGGGVYTPNEKLVLEYFFTNSDKNVYCATENMSSPLWAFLTGQYSRSELSMRDRLLQLFSDMEKAMRKGDIKPEDYISIEEFARYVRIGGKNPALQIFDKKASDFLEKWGVKYGHNSLKDNDSVRTVTEGVSQVFTKIIESPFPALGAFQEKSTRYMNFSADSLITPPELAGTTDEKILREIQSSLMDLYKESLPEVIKILNDEQIIPRDPELSDAGYQKVLSAKAFDMLRYLLPTSITTAVGSTLSTRTLENHLSQMMSHPLAEVRMIAKSMHEEALKITPGLLKFVAPDEYETSRRIAGESMTKSLLGNVPIPFYRGISDTERVKIIKVDEDLDDTILACYLFSHGENLSVSYSQCLKTISSLSLSGKRTLMRELLGERGRYNRFPREVQHGNMLVEFTCDFGAYRDVQRHRPSHQLWQGATGIIGYDYPEYFELPVFAALKKKYDAIMTAATKFARIINEKYSPHVAQYCSSLGHLVRTTFEMDPGQLAYMLELRTTPQGHQSYRRLFQELARQLRFHAPLFFEYIRLNENLEASRITEEKAAALKAKQL